MPPERTDLVLSSDVPDGERNVLVLNGLNVETYLANHYSQDTRGGMGSLGLLTNSRDSGNNLAQLELVQDGGLTSGIKTDLDRHSILGAHHTKATRPHEPSIYLSIKNGRGA